jgi:hypothetical protein
MPQNVPSEGPLNRVKSKTVTTAWRPEHLLDEMVWRQIDASTERYVKVLVGDGGELRLLQFAQTVDGRVLGRRNPNLRAIFIERELH